MFAPRNSSPPLNSSDEVTAYQIKLKKVLGLTVCSNAALDASSVNGLLAYPAGCTVVLFNAKKHTQSYLVNTSRKAITAVTFSNCGRYIATGESGINPAIKVWELDLTGSNPESNSGGIVIAEFLGHKNVVSCLAFSPTGKYLVSVGSQNDMIVNVFDWKLNLKIASNKVSAKVSAVSFSEDGSYFVTVGNRHVKYWYLKGNGKYKEPLPLMGRSAILGDHHDNDFSAVACGKAHFSDRTFAITRVGHLVEFNSRRLLDKWVACRTNQASCISITPQFILVGCAEAIIRIFHPSTLEYITTLPRTHYLGVDVANGLHINHIMTAPPSAKYPDTVAMSFDEARSKVTCVYNDHSMYIWDLRDIKRVGKSNSFLYHSTCIWGVESVPYSVNQVSKPSPLPEDCFLTCSSDDTIRVWGLDDCQTNESYRKNIYSKNLLKVIYIDDDLSFIKDVDNMNLGSSADKNSPYDGRNGVRCIKINADLDHVACGDRSGNIRIYDLNTVKLLTTIEAHDLEVLCLEYTNANIERKLLASASRDRLIHVFDVNHGYQILQTLDDHSSSITSIKFVGSGSNFQMISCGVDKSILFRQYQNNQFLRGMHCSGKSTLYDMEVDSNSKHILTACQDRNIRVYSTQNAKHTKTFKGSHSDDGSLVKLSLDPSGIYLATSCTDKTISVFDCYSNECMARMYGHSELVTGLKFTNDCKYLISSSGDGCVFIWQVPHDMIVTMQARLSQQRLRSGQTIIPRSSMYPMPKAIPETPIKEPIAIVFNDEVAMTPGYKFSDVGQLPQWAKRKPEEPTALTNASSMGNLSSSPSQSSLMVGGIHRARGRWAQRGQIETDALDLRSNSESPLGGHTTSSTIQTSDYNSASSKDIIYNQTYLSEDSSIDSGMETRRELNFAVGGNVTANTLTINRPLEKKKLTFETNHDHDGDVEDMSDGERTSSDHGGYFPAISPGTPTEFKVNAMDEAELRKSIKRQKFEKSGLPLRASSAGTGTGTGTSDTEDEASTPSAENADRSLESALGGSMESISIQQDSSTFLQAALDGPSGFPERGDKTRRSISAKHNTENSKSPSITKSYTSTKKEELLKVINEAKQKLENDHSRSNSGSRRLNSIEEVGYRSNLRGSQSISDLSHTLGTPENSRYSRYSKPGYNECSNNPNASINLPLFFNCAAPKSVLTRNYNLMRTLHQNYPPYPRNIGVYTPQEPQRTKSTQENISPSTTPKKPTLDINSVRKSSILKNYKSCPVSPVNEEVDWSNLPRENKNIIFTEPKSQSMYSDDARSILDMIHSDTEKMIEEITQKYGDLEVDEDIDDDLLLDNMPMDRIMHTSKSMPRMKPNDDGNFSSDSLENCSLDLDYDDDKVRKKKVCKKHVKKKEPKSYEQAFTYEEFRRPRYVSLSDILDDDKKLDKEYANEANYLETHRHSSASFFLTSYPMNDRKSQDSIISDYSCCNSLESILSDESDCKSAPLEFLFDKCKEKQPMSKSYGSSPNSNNTFDYYMRNRKLSGYEASPLPTSNTCPQLHNINVNDFSENDIPTLKVKNQQYDSKISRSITQEFATQRQQQNSNPLIQKPPIPAKPQNLGIRKSCTFSVETKGCQLKGPRTASVVKKLESNLQKFESEKRQSMKFSKSSGALNSCLKKEPTVNRRTASMRNKDRPKISVRFNTVSQIKYTPCYKRCSPKEQSSSDENKEIDECDGEKSFEVFIAETAYEEVDMDLYKKPQNIDKNTKNFQNEKVSQPPTNAVKEIEKKLDIINKLIQLEEEKLNQIRIAKESRMKPFNCSSKKGYVKSLTMNFDRLAKGIEKDIENEQMRLKIKRNVSLPDVLEVANLKDVMAVRGNASDIDEHDTEKIRNELDQKDIGNPKSMIPVTTAEESSIRRAISLSDLHMANQKSTPTKSQNSFPQQQKPTPQHRSNIQSRISNKRNSLNQSAKNSPTGMGSRSISVGVLNQPNSDSETDSNNTRGRPTPAGRVNGSPGNAAVRSYSTKNVNNNQMRRKQGLNTSIGGNPQDDSSSEETSNGVQAITKPVVPPRPRSLSSDQRKLTGNSPNMKARGTHHEAGDSNENHDLTHIINMLNTTTNAVLQFHSKLKNEESTSASSTNNNNLMLKELENAVIMFQNMLMNVTTNKNDQPCNNNSNPQQQSTTSSSSFGQPTTSETNAPSPFLTSEQLAHLENGDSILMMNKCADLLNKVRSKHKIDDCENKF